MRRSTLAALLLACPTGAACGGGGGGGGSSSSAIFAEGPTSTLTVLSLYDPPYTLIDAMACHADADGIRDLVWVAGASFMGSEHYPSATTPGIGDGSFSGFLGGTGGASAVLPRLACGDVLGAGAEAYVVVKQHPATPTTPGLISVVVTGAVSVTFPGDVEYAGGTLVDVVLGDWNGDGADDVALVGVSAAGPRMTSFLSIGSTGLDSGHLSSLPDPMTPVAMAAGDFDVDGDDDVVVGLGFDGYVIMVSQGDGTFTFDAPLDLLSSGRFASMVGGDFDGDGLTDMAGVLVQNGQPDRIGFLKGNGNGVLGPAVVETDLDPSPGAASLGRLHAGDVDGDGLDDLACGAPSANRTLVLLADGTGRFDAASDPRLVGGAHDTLDLVDLDGDGDLDLLIGDAALVTVRALLNELL